MVTKDVKFVLLFCFSSNELREIVSKEPLFALNISIKIRDKILQDTGISQEFKEKLKNLNLALI